MERDIRKLIGEKVRKARKEANLSQQQLGDKLFCHRTNVSYIEQGKVSIPADRLIDFSNALNKPMIYFLSDIQ